MKSIRKDLFFYPVSECPLCRTSADRSISRFKVTQLLWDIDVVECSECGILYKSLFPTLTTLNHIYNDSYTHHQKTETNPDSFISRLKRLGKPGGRHLDFGCGNGDFVKIALQFGWDSYGCDPYLPDHLMSDSSYENRFFKSDLTDQDLSRQVLGTFDCISMWAVAEHLRDPGIVFKNLGDLLSPGGTFIFNAPFGRSQIARKAGSRWQMAILAEHLIFFTFKSVKRIAEMSGLQIRKIRIAGSPYPFGKCSPSDQGFRSLPFEILEIMAKNTVSSELENKGANLINRIKNYAFKKVMSKGGQGILADLIRISVDYMGIGDHIEVMLIKK